MFQKLELSHSLYDITVEKLFDFKNLARHFLQQDNSILQKATIHNKLDNYAIVFNMWLFLQENKEDLFFISDKMMPYASNFYIFEQLRRNDILNTHKEVVEYSDSYAFTLSYFLSEEIIDWVYHVLEQHEETSEIMEINQDRDYFKLENDFNLTNDETHRLYVEQKYVTKTLATSIAMNGDFNRAIKKGIKKATNYAQDLDVNERNRFEDLQNT